MQYTEAISSWIQDTYNGLHWDRIWGQVIAMGLCYLVYSIYKLVKRIRDKDIIIFTIWREGTEIKLFPEEEQKIFDIIRNHKD